MSYSKLITIVLLFAGLVRGESQINGLILTVDGQQIDLATEAPNVQTYSVNPSWTVSVNNVEGRPRISSFTVRRGGSYFVVQNENDEVVHVRGPGLSLVSNGQSGNLKEQEIPAITDIGEADAIGLPGVQSIVGAASDQPRCQPGDPTREIELAVASDFEFCNDLSLDAANAEATLRALITEVSVSYEIASCLIVTPKYIELHCSTLAEDPYFPVINGLQGADVLYAFRTLWTTTQKYIDVHRDLAMLITGWDDSSGTAGVAFVGVACSQTAGFGWSEFRSSPVVVVVHELGHNMNLNHINTADDGPGVMAPFVGSVKLFSATSTNFLQAYLLDSETSCLVAPSESPSATPTNSPTETPSNTPSNSLTPTPTPSSSASPSPEPSMTSSSGPTPSASASQTVSSATPSASASQTVSSAPPSVTPSQSSTPTAASATPTSTASSIPSPSSSRIPPSPSRTPTPTPTSAPSKTSTPTPTSTRTPTPTPSPSETPSASVTPSASASISPTPSTSASPSMTPSPSPFTIEGCIQNVLQDSLRTPTGDVLRSCADPRNMTRRQRRQTRRLIRRTRRRIRRQLRREMRGFGQLNFNPSFINDDGDDEGDDDDTDTNDDDNPFAMFGGGMPFN